ncbi:MAG TPA: GerMN domain-containing protein [Candidatus Acidoferrales bacterium]|nr:GerMN domain-containing protein [Candidatus Acidoferrales bacterium]
MKIAIGTLAALVIAGVIYLPGLYRRVIGLGRMPNSEEAERREVVEPPVSTPTDAPVKAQLYWASKTASGTLEPTTVELRLSADPVERGKQLLDALEAQAPGAEARTLPATASLLEFYLLPGGVAVADFSGALATEMPSGIMSEQLAVDSIGRTLAANIPDLRELKILIDGREASTLAGHIDLTGYFLLQPAEAPGVKPAGAPPPGGVRSPAGHRQTEIPGLPGARKEKPGR